MFSNLIKKITTPTILALGFVSNLQVVNFAQSSMEPTIHDGDYGICWKVDSYRDEYKSIKTGDVVVVTSPDNPNTLICKRVGATEDNDVCHGNGDNYVDPSHLWLLGDNEGNSLDSRHYGAVPIGMVNSVVRFTFNFREFSFKLLKKY